jgi:hypothetical protein
MSPAQYKARYEQLQVPLDDGSVTEVCVNQYRIKGLAGHDVDEARWKTFYNALNKHHVDMELRVDPGARSYRVLHRNRDSSFGVTQQTVTGPEKVGEGFLKRIAGMARYCFLGKGAPEHCQIVLQLVEHWNLAPEGLQKYADKALGLDCNGFVGNYLWHGTREQSWDSLGLAKGEEGPDVSIDGYFDRRKAIRKWEDLNPVRPHILGLVGPGGNIIPGGSLATAGHIAITQPGALRPGTAGQRPAVWVVECTAGHDPGLVESWYSFLSVNRAGVFTLKRESMKAGSQVLNFKIAPV